MAVTCYFVTVTCALFLPQSLIWFFRSQASYEVLAAVAKTRSEFLTFIWEKTKTVPVESWSLVFCNFVHALWEYVSLSLSLSLFFFFQIHTTRGLVHEVNTKKENTCASTI